jgi:hypothetical protein
MSTKPVCQIPLDYAPKLGVDPSFIYHFNAGRRGFSIDMACKFLDLARDDPRLKALTILDLLSQKNQTSLKKAIPHILTIPGIWELRPTKLKKAVA